MSYSLENLKSGIDVSTKGWFDVAPVKSFGSFAGQIHNATQGKLMWLGWGKWFETGEKVTIGTFDIVVEDRNGIPYLTLWKEPKPKTKRSHVRPFESLTKKGQAVRIAKDVLAQLNAGKYIAQVGRWVGNLSIYKPIQAELANTSCTACAIGSIVLSACNLDPNKKGLSWNSALAPETGQLGFATKYFDNPGEIEAFFESNQGASRVAQTLGTLEWNDETRLRVIMNNIIKNRGVFNLTEALTDIEKEPKL